MRDVAGAGAGTGLGRQETFDAAMELVSGAGVEVWPLEAAIDVMLARQLHERHPELQARDLCYMASCQRRAAFAPGEDCQNRDLRDYGIGRIGAVGRRWSCLPRG